MWWFCACIVAISTATLTDDEYGPFNTDVFFYGDDRIAFLHKTISMPTSDPNDFVNWYLKANSGYTKLTGVFHPADTTWWYFNTDPNFPATGTYTIRFCKTHPCPSEELPIVCISNNHNNNYLSDSSPTLYSACSTGEKWHMISKLGVSNVVFLYNVHQKTYLGINKANPRASQLQFYTSRGIETEWTISGEDDAKCIKSNNNGLFLADSAGDPYYGLHDVCSTGEKWTIELQEESGLFALFSIENGSLLGVFTVLLAILLFINVVVMCRLNYFSCKKNKRNGYKNVKVVDSDELDAEVVPIINK